MQEWYFLMDFERHTITGDPQHRANGLSGRRVLVSVQTREFLLSD